MIFAECSCLPCSTSSLPAPRPLHMFGYPSLLVGMDRFSGSCTEQARLNTRYSPRQAVHESLAGFHEEWSRKLEADRKIEEAQYRPVPVQGQPGGLRGGRPGRVWSALFNTYPKPTRSVSNCKAMTPAQEIRYVGPIQSAWKVETRLVNVLDGIYFPISGRGLCTMPE